MRIALVGNPNCGKTTVFNRLTGARQKVGNWPGVTVEKKTGSLVVGEDLAIEVTDLPGLYNLDQIDPGQDEQVATEYLLSNQTDLIINILDAANLNRNLILTSQLLEFNQPLIVVVNMVDVAKQHGVNLDFELLAERLKVPVVPVVGSTGQGIGELRDEIKHRLKALQDEGESRNQAQKICAFGGEEDHLIGRNIKRFQQVRGLTEGVVQRASGKATWSENIDRLVLNRWLGIPIFLLMMYLMFTVAVNVGAVFIDFFDILFGAFLVDGTAQILLWAHAPQWLIAILASGVGAGIQLVATFIPVIGFLYLCLSMLEDSGYLSRAAFVIDRLMAKIGLPGNAFVPLIVGFGCNVPAVMAARTMNRQSDQLLTIVMAPFMSCGARLTVYALFAAAFFPNNGENIVFLLYLLGILVAVLSGWIFRKQIFSAKAAPSFIEMPAYHAPVWRNIMLTTWHRLSGFIKRAGKTIVLVVTLLSFMNSIGTDGSFGNENSRKSILSVIGQQITPIFSPLGIKEDNWPATVGIFTGIFAKEAIVGTLDALYVGEDLAADQESLDLYGATLNSFVSIKDNFLDLLQSLGDPLGLGSVTDIDALAEDQGVDATTLTTMAGLFDGQVGAFCYLVLILLYTPCVAVLGAIRREAGLQWMWLVVGWTSFLAYSISSLIYQVASWSERPLFATLWCLAVVATWGGFIVFLKQIGHRIRNAEIFAVSTH